MLEVIPAEVGSAPTRVRPDCAARRTAPDQRLRGLLTRAATSSASCRRARGARWRVVRPTARRAACPRAPVSACTPSYAVDAGHSLLLPPLLPLLLRSPQQGRRPAQGAADVRGDGQQGEGHLVLLLAFLASPIGGLAFYRAPNAWACLQPPGVQLPVSAQLPTLDRAARAITIAAPRCLSCRAASAPSSPTAPSSLPARRRGSGSWRYR